MYFWRIEQLKKSLVVEPNQLESLKYVVALLIARACLELEIAIHRHLVPPSQELRMLDSTTLIAAPVFLIVGIVYCFIKNGGRKGSAFLPRFVALGWVMGIRFVSLTVLPVIFVLEMICHSRPSQVPSLFWSVATILVIVFYWRLGVHFADVRELERSTQPKPDGDGLKPAPKT
jgi:hypothetical protein